MDGRVALMDVSHGKNDRMTGRCCSGAKSPLSNRVEVPATTQWIKGTTQHSRPIECYYIYIHDCMYGGRTHIRDTRKPERRPCKRSAMARSTKLEALETRGSILDAAERIFHAQGFSRSSLEDVAQAAQVTRGAIYWHFKNKSDLFEAMLERVKLPMEAIVEAGGNERQPDPLGQLRGALVFVLQEIALNPQSRMVFEIIFLKCELVDATEPLWVRRQQSARRAQENFQRILRNAVARGQLPADLDVPLACTAMRAMMGGLISNWVFMPAQFDLANQAQRLVDGCLDMVRYAPSLRAPPA